MCKFWAYYGCAAAVLAVATLVSWVLHRLTGDPEQHSVSEHRRYEVK